MGKYRKISSETRSLVSSEASQGKVSSKVNSAFFDKTIGSISFEVHVTSIGANTTCDEVSQESRKTNFMVKANTTVEINFPVKLLSRLNKLELTIFTAGRPLL